MRQTHRTGAILMGMGILLALTGCGKAGIQAAETAVVSNAALPVEEEALPAVLTFTEADRNRGDLILVSREHGYDFAANADLSLVRIREAQSYAYPVDKEEFQLAERILPALDQMIRDCDEAMGTSYTSISSAWRSKEYQQSVWDEMEELYGEDYAKKYVAVPGFSEHHTGLALDLGITYEDGSAGTFSESENAKWMAANAHHYGFVRRYAEDKTEITGISNEAWHFRYVGQPHATYMYAHNLCLEEYLTYLQEHTSVEAPLQVSAEGVDYEVFYTLDENVMEPSGSYTVSGDNAGGMILTSVQ